MSLQDFLQSAKQGQTTWFIVTGFLVRGSFVRVDPGHEFVHLSQVAIFQSSQATGSMATISIALSSIHAWG
jgi:hypothetical protein